jgi:hypothetical protein
LGGGGDSSSISGNGKLLPLFGWILLQTPSQLLPHVELLAERGTAMTSQLLYNLSVF